ncbi:hypothetical protein SUGI_0788000 [Cryptomeria japonica]|nr:hypothetical protein SUGI_0788000 [Cryptomeria japonica]
MPRNRVSSSAKRKLQMEEDYLSSRENSSNYKRVRVNDNELQGSVKRKKGSSVQKFEVVDLEEVQVQTYFKDKAIGNSQPAIDDAKLSPDGGSRVRRLKRFESRSPSKSPIYVRRWSNDQEICLMNAILDTRTPHGKINRAAFYQQAREQLQLEVSNYKLYEKMKDMKKKFESMVKKKKEGGLDTDCSPTQHVFVVGKPLGHRRIWKV